MSRRVLFARVGWMKYYNGPQAGDARPVGGGSYTAEHIGLEVYNFQNLDGHYYGHFKPAGPRKQINLARIEPGFGGQFIENTLVIFIARHPDEGGQLIVGWYDRATVFDRIQESRNARRGEYGYLCTTSAEHACLLPTARRAQPVPHGKGGMGQPNVRYVFDEKGNRNAADWIEDAIAYVDAYEGENALLDDKAEAEDAILTAAEVAAAGRRGQQFCGTVEDRKAVEMQAMEAAVKHFTGLGYTCDPSVHKTKSYDILCKQEDRERYVEVKGTQGGPVSVFLTRGEVKHVRSHGGSCALFVLHGIKLHRKGNKVNATGGEPFVILPWELDEASLEPLAYEYRLPGKNR